MATIVQCPKCKARVQLPPSAKRVVCPRCGSAMSVPSPTNLPVVKPPPQPPAPSKPLGFFGYFSAHFAATRWPAALGVCCGLLAAPVLSLLKPVLGFRGMAVFVVVLGSLSVINGLAYVVQRFVAYFFKRERSVPENASSWTARIAYGGSMSLLPLCLLIGGEYFAPSHGLLATIVPRLRDEQARWFATQKPDANREGPDTKSLDVAPTQDKPSHPAPTQPQDKKIGLVNSPSSTKLPESSQPPQQTQLQEQQKTVENPFVVVEDASPGDKGLKKAEPKAGDKPREDNPFQVIEESPR